MQDVFDKERTGLRTIARLQKEINVIHLYGVWQAQASHRLSKDKFFVSLPLLLLLLTQCHNPVVSIVLTNFSRRQNLKADISQ
jgi:hypothetical protein